MSIDAYVETGTVSVYDGISGYASWLYLAGSGNGGLSVRGGLLVDNVAILGEDAGSSGSAVITGGTWNTVYTMTIGSSGAGALTVSGGLVQAQNAWLGYIVGSSGTVAVTGGTWSLSGTFCVGGKGSASMEISGGLVSDLSAYIGSYITGPASVTVTGGTWANTSTLTVGYSEGTGTLTITNKGVVSVNAGEGNLILGAGSTLNLGTGGSAGTLKVQSVVSTGTATVNFNHVNYYTAPNLVGDIDVYKMGSGTTVMTSGSLVQSVRSVTVSTGGLKVDGYLSTDRGTTVANGATLSGTGTVNGSVYLGGTLAGSLTVASLGGSGMVAPGGVSGPGILTVNNLDPTGGLDFAFTFTLANANPLYGNAAASGNSLLFTTLNAALTIDNNVSFYLDEATLGDTYLGGFFSTLSAAQLEELLKNADFAYYVKDASGSVVFNGVRYSKLEDAMIALSVVNVTDAVFSTGTASGSEVKLSVVPEPGAWGLLFAGLGFLILWQRHPRRAA